MYRILLVDDEPIAIEAIVSMIDKEKLGISDIDYAYDVDDAQEMLENTVYDILVCDIEMPEKTGMDLIKWLNGKNMSTICIFLTCHPEFSYAQQAITLGIFSYLIKPISSETLNSVLHDAIEKRKSLLTTEHAKEILGDLTAGIETENTAPDPTLQTIEEAKNYILNHIGDEELDVKSVAAHVYLNPDYLSRLFKTHLNSSVKGFIVTSRIALASELLVGSTLSVSKIAMSCGYSHMAHFSKMFKQETGLTPNEYRARYKQ